MPVETPECDRLKEINDNGKRETVQDFLDWLTDRAIILCKLDESESLRCGEYYPIRESREQIMAEFFGIDLKKVEREKQALLDDFVKSQGR